MERSSRFGKDDLERQLAHTEHRAADLKLQLAAARQRHALFPKDAVSAHRIASLPLEIAATQTAIDAVREQLAAASAQSPGREVGAKRAQVTARGCR
jgi:hypothetical protein